MSNSISRQISDFLGRLASSAASCLRVVMSLPAPRIAAAPRQGRPLVILGNGPALKKNLEEDMEALTGGDTLAVNFFANSPEFFKVRPKYYVLADPHFFDKALTDPNVSRLIGNLNAADFQMTLYIPSTARFQRTLFTNPNLAVGMFSFNAVEGFGWLEDAAFGKALGMPRPRNVLIPSIMLGIWLGYKEIYLLGADHSWLKTLSVNDCNEVVSIQPHFYKEDEKEIKRVREEYVRHPLHEVLESMMIAFRSYHRIRRYADSRGVRILNATPGSMIDAFERASLPENLL